MMKMIALENDGAINNEKDFGLLQIENHLWSVTEQVIARSMDVPVRWRALLEELVQVGDKELFLTKRRIMKEAAKFPGFEQSHHGVEAIVMEMLYYFRDLGELTVFDMSSQAGDSSSMTAEKCIIFVKPEKLLCVLRAIIGPSEIVAENLEADQKIALEQGIVGMQVLDALWKDVPDEHRLTMLETLCSFDLLMKLEWGEQGQGKVGIPALMPCLGPHEDFVRSMGLGRGERDVEVSTVFGEFFPVGLIGVLVANLHSTVGRERTDVRYIRADAVLLSLSERERVLMKYVQSGHNSMKAHIKWLFRGKAPVGIAHRCLLQFCTLIQSQFRKVATTSFKHVIILDCARDLSCCPSDVADCDGHGCGGKGSVELRIDTERLWDDGDSSELHLRGAHCSRPECQVYHDHAPLKDPVVGRAIVVGPSQPVMTEPSRKRKRHEGLNSRHGSQKRRELGSSAASAAEKADDEHIKHGRYDLFISFHGGEELAQGITTRFIVGEAVKRIRDAVRNRGVAPGPSIFFDETEVKGPLTDIFKAVMQTRGGGAALFLLTKAYFARKYCLAELRAFMDMHERAVARGHIGVKLRFICLGPSVDDILNDQNIKNLVPGLPESCIQAFGEEKDVVRGIADAFLDAWKGNNTTPGINLGKSVQESFGHLAVALKSVDIDTAKRLLLVKGARSSMQQVLYAALEDGTISFYDVKKLHDVITASQSPRCQSERNELEAYERKWCDAEHWKWGRDVLDGMCDMVEEAKKDIAEQFPR